MTDAIVRHDGTTALTIADTMTLAETFARSGFFSDTRDAAQAVVKILAGRELGFGPMASMTGIHIIKGKVAASATIIASAIQRSGRYGYNVRALTDARCELEFTDNGAPVGESVFTMDDAKAAGLLGNQTWKQYPRNMLFARAISNGARWYCPAVFGGPMYTPDELGAAVDGETGEVVDVRPAPQAPAPPPAVAGIIAGTPPDDWPADQPVASDADLAAVEAAAAEQATAKADADTGAEVGVSIRSLCEAAIRDHDVAALPMIKARVGKIGNEFHRTNARRWLALATVLIDNDNLSDNVRRTARGLIDGMPDDTPGKSQAIDILVAEVDA